MQHPGAAMRKYYVLRPEVAGYIGEGSIPPLCNRPDEYTKIVYQFEAPPNDCIIEADRQYFFRLDLIDRLQNIQATGFALHDFEIRVGDQFDNILDTMEPNWVFPEFKWLKIHGQPGEQDIARDREFRILVSQRVLNAMKDCGDFLLTRVYEFKA